MTAIVPNLVIPHEVDEESREDGFARAAATVAGTDGLDDDGRDPIGRAAAAGPTA